MTNGCTTFPILSRLGPFKNVFCKECNRALTNFYYVERNVEEHVSLAWLTESVSDLNSLSAARKVHTMYGRPRFDSIATIGDIAGENPDEEYSRNFINILIELGKMCGYENLCDQK